MPLGSRPELLPIQRQAGFQAQGVACAEAHRRGARREQRVPEDRPLFAGDEHLEAHGLARVAGACEPDVGSRHAHHAQLVPHRLRQLALLEQLGDDAPRLGPLQGEHRQLLAAIGQLDRTERVHELLEVVPVLLPVGGVDDQQVLVRQEAIQVGVVDSTAGLGGNDRVLGLADVQGAGVVGQHVLQERHGAGAANDETPHVRDVEQAGVLARRQVLLDDAGVLDRHVPAGEVDHRAPRAT